MLSTIQVHGLLRARPEGTENMILYRVLWSFRCVDHSQYLFAIAFIIDEHASQEEEVRLKTLFDLRRADMAKSLSAFGAANCVRSHLQKICRH